MKAAFQSELYKALTNKLFYIVLAIGTGFCVMDVAENRESMEYFDGMLEWMAGSGLRLGTGHEGYSLFYLWMGWGPNTRGALLFYTVWPVLAAIPYGWSYADERRSGVYYQIVARIGAENYYISKYFATFVSGGLAVALPMLMGLLVNAMFVPYAEITPVYNLLDNRDFLSGLFFQNHWLYALVWNGIQFLCGGAAACLCFAVGTKMRHGVMVILTPYAIYVALDAFVGSLRTSVLHDVSLALSPLRMIYANPGWHNPAWLIVSMLGAIVVVSLVLGYWQVVKHELA